MKANEALKIIDKVHDYPCPYGIGGTAWQFIRSCIEKQIPKKVKVEKRSKDLSVLVCPICSKPSLVSMSYCKHCGQALDWSDEE